MREPGAECVHGILTGDETLGMKVVAERLINTCSNATSHVDLDPRSREQSAITMAVQAIMPAAKKRGEVQVIDVFECIAAGLGALMAQTPPHLQEGVLLVVVASLNNTFEKVGSHIRVPEGTQVN